jgi:outer membrane protein assembly factor BamB
MHHYDIGRTGQNTSETLLTPSNVNSTTFGRLFTEPVDGLIYAQPLYMPGVAIPNQGTHNVVYVETENDSVYAFDADTGGAALWQVSFLINGATVVKDSVINATDVYPQVGITGTPVMPTCG